jgi:MFS family permease
MTYFPSTPGSPYQDTGWLRTLTLMTGVQIAATASMLALTSVAPAAATTLGIGAHWIGYQVSLIYFAGMFASAFAGSIVEKLRAERVIFLELFLFAGGLLMIATASAPLIVFGSVCLGVAYGLNNPASSEILNSATPRHRHSFVFSFKQSGVPLGAMLANLSLPALTLVLGGSWQLAVLLAALVPITLLLITGASLKPKPIRTERGAPVIARMLREQRDLYRNRRLRALAVIGGMYSAMQLVATAYVVVTLVDVGWSIVAAGSVAAALQLAGAVGRVAWGLVADRIGAFRVLALIGAISGLLMASLYWVEMFTPLVLVVILVSLGGVASGWNGVFLAAAARSAPEGKVGSNTGVLLVYTFIGVIVGPSTYAVLYGMLGSYASCFAVFSLIGFAGTAVAAPHFRRQTKTPK